MNSMTGFGRGHFRVGGRTFRVELRTYNNRFLDVKQRLPWVDGELETRVAGAVRERVARGRVEVAVWDESPSTTSGRIGLDRGLAADLGRILTELTRAAGCDLPTAARLLPPMRELVVAEGPDADSAALWELLRPGLESALTRLVETRATEGAALHADLAAHLAQLRGLAGTIRGLSAQEPLRRKERLVERISELQGEVGGGLDPARIHQEAAHLADRCDVNEELARVDSHLDQLEGVLEQEGPVGRHVDFLLQELNRELSTIAAKTIEAEVAHRVVEAKAIVERLREQAQNVE